MLSTNAWKHSPKKTKQISEDFTDEKQTFANLTHRFFFTYLDWTPYVGGNDAFGKIGEMKMENVKKKKNKI